MKLEARCEAGYTIFSCSRTKEMGGALLYHPVRTVKTAIEQLMVRVIVTIGVGLGLG